MTANYKEETLKLLRAIYRDGMEDLIAYLENDTDFFTAPASTKYHSNFIGGLVEHSIKSRNYFGRNAKHLTLMFRGIRCIVWSDARFV